MKKVIPFIFLLLLTLPFSFAYIDPGTGGYLISIVWQYVVAFFAFASAAVIYFFKFTIKQWFAKKWVKYFFITLITILILFGVALIVSSFQPSTTGGLVVHYVNQTDGVSIYKEDKTFDGYTYYNGRLIDMQGNIVHNWSNKYMGVIDSDGTYYAQRSYNHILWGAYTFNDSLIWNKTFPIHHEIAIDGDELLVLSMETHEYNDKLVEFDVLYSYNKTTGELLWKWSTWDNFAYLQDFHEELPLDSEFFVGSPKNDSPWGGEYEYYHANAVSLVPENSLEQFHPAFTPGNYIISFRYGSMVWILDRQTTEVLWTGMANQVPGTLEGQHSPHMLENGNLLIFDNGVERGWSRIIELNPVTMEIEWEYTADNFFTATQGYVQPLPNGNMLVTQTESGRIFELTKEKEIVWEYFTDLRVNETVGLKVSGDRVDIYRATRYEKEFIDGLLDE